MNWFSNLFRKQESPTLVPKQNVIDGAQPGVCVLNEPIIGYKKILCSKTTNTVFGIAKNFLNYNYII